MPESLKVSGLEAAIAGVELDRPDKKNALSLDLFEALPQAAASIADAPSVRAVVISGAGGDFCAGLDLSVMTGFAARIDEIREMLRNPPAGEEANFFQKPVTCWQALDVPVIAAIQGVCFGGGLQLALGADFRICAPDARFSVMEARWGLVPDMGISQSLPRLVRADQAMDLIMSARVFGADEALALGLVTRISEDPVAAAQEMAAGLAARSPDALAAAKRLVHDSWTMDRAAALALEAGLQARIIGRHNQVEAVMANMQKRDPEFR